MATGSKKGQMVVTTVQPSNNDGLAQFDLMPVLIEQRDNRRAQVKRSALVNFLSQIKDGVIFSHRTIRPSMEFAQQDYYAILRWMKVHELVDKHGGAQYSVPSINAVKEEFNAMLERRKL